MHERRAFTLIELLVVISIVALLASVVMAALNSARAKGKLGAARQFAAQVYHAAADSALAIWDFDECSGTAQDLSGNGYAGTLQTGASWVAADGPSGRGCAASFNGTSGYVQTSFTKNSGDGTVSAWFKMSSQTSDPSSYIRPVISQGNFDGAGAVNPQGILISIGRQGHADYGKIRFDWGTDDNFYTTSSSYLDGQWHNAVMSKAGTVLSIYVDGAFVATHVATDSVDYTSPFQIGGSTTSSARRFLGVIDEVRVYDKSLSASEVGKLYAEGLTRVLADR